MNKTHTPELSPEVLGRLRVYAALFHNDLRHEAQRSWSGVYLRGLLQDGDRKSIEPMVGRVPLPAELLAIRDPKQALQQFVNKSPWDELRVLHRFRAVMAPTFADPEVVRLLQTHRRTGSIAPKPHRGGHPPALGPEDLERLRELVRQQPDATLEELRQRLGVSCSTMAICRALKKLGLPRKKKIPRANDQDRPDVQEQRREFCETLSGIDPHRLVFVDECGANTSMTRTYGRAPAGERVYTDTPGHWDSITLTCGLRLSEVMEALAFPGATNTAVFEDFVEHVLVPQLKPGDVVIWDNLKPHKSEEAAEAVEEAGASLVPLPPWSPDLTPIEEMASKVKGAMRSAAARTKEAVYAAFASALHDVTPEDYRGLVPTSCGVCNANLKRSK